MQSHSGVLTPTDVHMLRTAPARHCRGWLDPKTKEKFVLLGSDYTEKLLEIIDADQLPVECGNFDIVLYHFLVYFQVLHHPSRAV